MISTSNTPMTLVGGVLTAAALILILATTAQAGTVRDHRGQATLRPAPQLGCSSFKYCAKVGVIVRDHRTGATPGGK